MARRGPIWNQHCWWVNFQQHFFCCFLRRKLLLKIFVDHNLRVTNIARWRDFGQQRQVLTLSQRQHCWWATTLGSDDYCHCASRLAILKTLTKMCHMIWQGQNSDTSLVSDQKSCAWQTTRAKVQARPTGLVQVHTNFLFSCYQHFFSNNTMSKSKFQQANFARFQTIKKVLLSQKNTDEQYFFLSKAFQKMFYHLSEKSKKCKIWQFATDSLTFFKTKNEQW